MHKKLMLVIMTVACFCMMVAAGSAQGATRTTEDLSAGWRFLKADEAGAESPDYKEKGPWQNVDLPHTWNTEDVFDDMPGYYRGIGWYRKQIDVPKSLEGKRIVLRFEAVCSVATVYFNGELLGRHKGAWTPFEFDITDRVQLGRKNLVAVMVDNRWRSDVPPHGMDFNMMGGLHREVFLIATDPVHIASTRVTTPTVSQSQGVAAFEVEARNDSDKTRKIQVVTQIEGPGLAKPITLRSSSRELPPGETVLLKQQTKPIAGPKLWSPNEPNLYQVSFRLLVDGREADDAKSPLGFRTIRFDPNQGFFINGKHVKLKGVNRHDDYPGLGWALPHSRQIEDLKLIKEMGANFVRTAHYPQHPVVLDTCDKLGLMVWEEVPFDGEQSHKVSFISADDYARTIKHNLRETIRRDRNHPCIILWSMGNENMKRGLDNWRAVTELTRQLERISKEEDPTRPTAVAIDKPDHAKKAGLTEAVDILGYNIYAGWYKWNIEDFADMVDAFHRENPTKPIIISEYGAGIEKGLHSESPRRMDFSEEHGCNFHESYWKSIAEKPYIAGGLIWNVFDFAVKDRHRVKKQTIPHMNQKGIFTYDRRPKDVYYFYRSQWTDEPMVYIVSHTWTKRKAGSTPIRVYSNCDTVELMLNGKSLGTKNKDQKFVWDVPLASGKNVLQARAKKGNQHIDDTLRITGE